MFRLSESDQSTGGHYTDFRRETGEMQTRWSGASAARSAGMQDERQDAVPLPRLGSVLAPGTSRVAV